MRVGQEFFTANPTSPILSTPMPPLAIRTFEEGDEAGLGQLLDRCFGRFETWTAERVAELAAGPPPQLTS